MSVASMLIAHICRLYKATATCEDCGAVMPPQTKFLSVRNEDEVTRDYCQHCAPDHLEEAEALGILPNQRTVLMQWAAEAKALQEIP